MVDALLDEDRVIIIGRVLTEVLLGFRRTEHADWVASALLGTHERVLEWDEWRYAAQLGRELARRGHELPLTDLVVAAIALRHDLAVYTNDPHFDGVPDLKRFVAG